MINDKTINRITKAIPKKVMAELQDLSIISDGPGSYCMYNLYHIKKQGETFIVSSETSSLEQPFNTLKSAATWCSYDKRNRIAEAKRIIILDFKLSSVEADITLHTTLLKRAKTADDKLIYAAKLTEEKLKKKQIAEELNGFINESMSWQARRWNKKP
jgi:hypothetical protein